MTSCEFCEIIAGNREAFILDENEHTITFLDEKPATLGHSLVVPRVHTECLFLEKSDASKNVFQAVNRLSVSLRDTLEIEGVSLFYTSAGLVGTVNHAHVHVVPRYEDDDIHLSLKRSKIDEHNAMKITDQIRSKI